MTLPNSYEREVAANFYFEELPKAVVNWIQTGVEIEGLRVDEDVVALAHLLARYRVRVQRAEKNKGYDRYER